MTSPTTVGINTRFFIIFTPFTLNLLCNFYHSRGVEQIGDLSLLIFQDLPPVFARFYSLMFWGHTKGGTPFALFTTTMRDVDGVPATPSTQI